MRLLIAEDDTTSRMILEGVVRKWGYDPVSVHDGTAAWDILLDEKAPKLLLLDWEMPGVDGIEICRRLRKRDTGNPSYVILLTGNTETEDIVRGLDAGASDYICKPYKNEELLARLKVGERMLKLQADLNGAKGVLAHQAMHDPLTDMYNRRAILDILEHELSRARRTGKYISIGICDIDHFKQINDCYGHQAGDDVLVAYTRVVNATLRGGDYIGRWGGEEFLIIAPQTGTEESSGLFERIRKNIEAENPPAGPDKECIGFTVSIGVVRSSGAELADRLLSAADRAMYAAKKAGRNRVVSGSVDAEYCTTEE